MLAHVTEQQGVVFVPPALLLICESEAILASILKCLLGVRNVIKPVSNSNLSVALRKVINCFSEERKGLRDESSFCLVSKSLLFSLIDINSLKYSPRGTQDAAVCPEVVGR